MLTNLRDRLHPLKQFADCTLAPVALLIARLVVARDFFMSGRTKLAYVLDGDAASLYFLFQEYNVPLLPLHTAAWMGMIGELTLSMMLAFGFMGRFGALGLMVMCAVIYHVDQNQLAPFWAAICGIIAAQGCGRLSLDAWLFKQR